MSAERRFRFAPSPTGPLHLGHAYSLGRNAQLSHAHEGALFLRMDDLDQSRARAAWADLIFEDIAWLGIPIAPKVTWQSKRLDIYHKSLEKLWDMDLLYPCTCGRRDIEAAANAPQEGAPLVGPDGVVYPGTCRSAPRPTQMPSGVPLRLDMARAAVAVGTIEFFDHETRTDLAWDAHTLCHHIGDVVLLRRNLGASYHLSTVIDDAETGITDVCRAADLQDATAVHIVLQRLLNLPTPRYWHHAIIRDERGKRLAKRDDARAISIYREAGHSPAEIWAMVGLPLPSA